MSLLTFFFFFLLFLLLLINYKWHNKNPRYKFPPGPKKFPFIGNLHQLGSSPHKSFHHLSQKHGPLMFLTLGSIPTIVISSAEITKEVFKNHDRVFSARPALYAAEKLTYGCLDMTFSPYGNYWREIRKIATLELFSLKRVQMFEAVRIEEVKLLIHSIAKCLDAGPIDLSKMTMKVANDVICRVAFGKKYGNNMFYEVLEEMQIVMGEFNVADFFPWLWWINKFNGCDRRIKKSFEILDDLYDKVIEEHLGQNYVVGNEDFVHVLLSAQKDPNHVISLNNNQIKALLMDMFAAGTDTSATTVDWIMSELIRHPLVMSKAQEEVRTTVNVEKGIVEESDLPQLPYLKAILKEGLRLHPPLPLLVPRETTEECTILGYRIPAKTRVFVDAKSLSADPECWKIRPNDFWPERFLNCPIDFRGKHFEFLPFGAGRRGCPGTNFAVMFVELILANLLYSFDWKLPDGMEIQDLDMEERFGLTVHKNVPLSLVATPAYLHN